jgi:outer membrane protein assembly factor BamB
VNDHYVMAGANPARVPARLELTAPLREEWATGCGARQPVGLLVTEGVLFTTDGKQCLVALDTVTGRRLWAYPWQAAAWVVHQGLLYAWPKDAELHRIDVRTGRTVDCLPCSAPAAAMTLGQHLLVQSNDYEWRAGVLSCSDLGSGNRLWSRRFIRDSSNHPAAFAATEGTVLVAPPGDGIVALAVDTGAVQWQRTWPEWGFKDGDWLRPVQVDEVWVLNSQVLAQVGRHLLCLSIEDGRTLWQAEGWGQCVYGNRIYGCNWQHGYEVRSAVDGTLLLRAPLGAKAPHSVGTAEGRIALVSETHAFVSTRQRGLLLAVERDTGVYAWHHQPKGGQGGVYGAPVPVSGRLYYRQFDRLFCLRPEGSR